MPWWQLKSIQDNHRSWARSYYAERPSACPYDGTPLQSGYTSQAGGGRLQELHCPFCGYSNHGERRLT